MLICKETCVIKSINSWYSHGPKIYSCIHVSAIDTNDWMLQNPDNVYHNHNDHNDDDDVHDFNLVDETGPQQRVKVRRKKGGKKGAKIGENPIKKYIVQRKIFQEFSGPFLTSTTTTEAPMLADSSALNRTAEDSRCKKKWHSY